MAIERPISNSINDRLNYIKSFIGSQETDPLDTRLVKPIYKLKTFSFRYITADENGRPELISYREYGTTELWWFLMEYNGLIHNLDVVAGVKLKIVPLPIITEYLNDSKDSQVAGTGTRMITI